MSEATLNEISQSFATFQSQLDALEAQKAAGLSEPFCFNEMVPTFRNLVDLMQKSFAVVGEALQRIQEAQTVEVSEPLVAAVEEVKWFLTEIPNRFAMLQAFVPPEQVEQLLPLISDLTEDCGRHFVNLSTALGEDEESASLAFAYGASGGEYGQEQS